LQRALRHEAAHGCRTKKPPCGGLFQQAPTALSRPGRSHQSIADGFRETPFPSVERVRIESAWPTRSSLFYRHVEMRNQAHSVNSASPGQVPRGSPGHRCNAGILKSTNAGRRLPGFIDSVTGHPANLHLPPERRHRPSMRPHCMIFGTSPVTLSTSRPSEPALPRQSVRWPEATAIGRAR
jgi:hypothetical protein